MWTRQSVSIHPHLLPSFALVLVALLSMFAWAPGASAAEVAVESTESEEGSVTAEAPSVCQESLGLDGIAPMICIYCDLENCGCIHIEGCVLEYSCTCSPIQCTRSCRNKFCIP